MNSYKIKVIAAICAGTLLTGCATQAGTDRAWGTVMGGVAGAALGCGIGLMIYGPKGCIIGAGAGAVTGAAVGWSMVKINQYKVEQVRSVRDDQLLYGFTKSKSSQIKIRKGMSTPNSVKPGRTVNLTTDYSVTLPRNVQFIAVTERWILKKDGEVLADLSQNGQRSSGGWSADARIPMPINAPLGTYVIEHKVQADESNDTDESTFIVYR